MSKTTWKNDAIQFPRLIAELESVGAFTPRILKDLCASMDVTQSDISELIDRAQAKWEKEKEKTRIKSQQYRVKIGKSYWFEYHCWESEESSDAELWHHSHQKVEIISMTEPGYGDTEEQRCKNTQPAMFKVKFTDGFVVVAAEDEILESRKQFKRPDPPAKS